MTAARRSWVATFADPAVLSDLYAAARSCMAQVCSDEAEDCDCPANRMTMLEFAEWVELEVRMQNGKPTHIRHAGQPHRRRADPRLEVNLSIAG